MNQLLAALGDNVKPSGRNWIARCPVHDDKDFAMSIKQADDGSVLAHCHACGANGFDLYQALRLDLDELFGGKKLDRNDSYMPLAIKEIYDHDQLVISIFKADTEKWKTHSLNDKRRAKLATARIEGIKTKYSL